MCVRTYNIIIQMCLFKSFQTAIKDQTDTQAKVLFLQMAERDPGLVFHIMSNNPGPVRSLISPSWCSCNFSEITYLLWESGKRQPNCCVEKIIHYI